MSSKVHNNWYLTTTILTTLMKVLLKQFAFETVPDELRTVDNDNGEEKKCYNWKKTKHATDFDECMPLCVIQMDWIIVQLMLYS